MNPETAMHNERAKHGRAGRARVFPGARAHPGKNARLAVADVRGSVPARKTERAELVQGLRECVAAHPDVSELRVLFGMALCVDFKVQEAIEELREGVRLAPDSFIAQLKMGELWMRLRVMRKGRRAHAPGRAAGAEHGAVGTGAPASGNHPNLDAQRNQARRLQL